MRTVMLMCFIVACTVTSNAQLIDQSSIPSSDKKNLFLQKKWKLNLSTGFAINFSQHDIDYDIGDIQPRKSKNGLFLGLEARKPILNNLSFVSGLHYQFKSSYWKLNQWEVKELENSYIEWWNKGYGLGVPLLLAYDVGKKSKLRLQVGTVLGINAITSKVQHKRTDINNPKQYWIGLGGAYRGEQEDFTTYFMTGLLGGLEWIPNTNGKWSAELSYQHELRAFGRFGVYAIEENVDLGIRKRHLLEGSTRIGTLNFKLKYQLRRKWVAKRTRLD